MDTDFTISTEACPHLKFAHDLIFCRVRGFTSTYHHPQEKNTCNTYYEMSFDIHSVKHSRLLLKRHSH